MWRWLQTQVRTSNAAFILLHEKSIANLSCLTLSHHVFWSLLCFLSVAFVSLPICYCNLHALICFLSSFLLFLFLFLFFFCSSSSFAAIDLARDDSSAGATAAGQVISEHLPLLHQMLQTLLQAGRGREGEAMAHILAFVGGLLPPALQQGISRAALEACQNADAQVSTKDLLLHTSFARCGVAHVLNTSLAPVIMNALPCALLTGMHPCFHAITN